LFAGDLQLAVDTHQRFALGLGQLWDFAHGLGHLLRASAGRLEVRGDVLEHLGLLAGDDRQVVGRVGQLFERSADPLAAVGLGDQVSLDVLDDSGDLLVTLLEFGERLVALAPAAERSAHFVRRGLEIGLGRRDRVAQQAVIAHLGQLSARLVGQIRASPRTPKTPPP